MKNPPSKARCPTSKVSTRGLTPVSRSVSAAALLVMLAAAFTAGCFVTPKPLAPQEARAQFVAALDAVGLEKAPALGPVYREFILAAYDKDFPENWLLINQQSRDALAKELPQRISGLETLTKKMEDELLRADISQAARDFYTQSVKEQKDLAAKLKSFNGDGEKYFILLMGKAAPSYAFSAEILQQMQVTGETIDGPRATLNIIHKSIDHPGAIPFTLENGDWKLDFMETTTR